MGVHDGAGLPSENRRVLSRYFTLACQALLQTQRMQEFHGFNICALTLNLSIGYTFGPLMVGFLRLGVR